MSGDRIPLTNMHRKLHLDRDKVDDCLEMSRHIVSNAHKYIQRHSSKSIEAASLYLMGVQAFHKGEPIAAALVKRLPKDALRAGVALPWGGLIEKTGEDPNSLAQKILKGKLGLPDGQSLQDQTKSKILSLSKNRLTHVGVRPKPTPRPPSLVLSLVEKKTKRLGTSIDKLKKKGIEWSWIPHLPIDEFHDWPSGFVTETLGIRGPVLALLAILKDARAIYCDAFFDTWGNGVSAHLAFVHQDFIFKLCRHFKIPLILGLSPRELVATQEKFPQILARIFLSEQLALHAGLHFKEIILVHPALTQDDSPRMLIGVFAAAQMIREIFAQGHLCYPVAFGLGDFEAWVAASTGQDIWYLLEGQKANLEKVSLWQSVAEDLASEINFASHGKIARQAHSSLDNAWKLLKRLEQVGLWQALEEGLLGPKPQASHGADDIFQKSYHYWNPVMEWLESEKTVENI